MSAGGEGGPCSLFASLPHAGPWAAPSLQRCARGPSLLRRARFASCLRRCHTGLRFCIACARTLRAAFPLLRRARGPSLQRRARSPCRGQDHSAISKQTLNTPNLPLVPTSGISARARLRECGEICLLGRPGQRSTTEAISIAQRRRASDVMTYRRGYAVLHSLQVALLGHRAMGTPGGFAFLAPLQASSMDASAVWRVAWAWAGSGAICV